MNLCEWCHKKVIEYQIVVYKYVGQEGSKWSPRSPTSKWAVVNVCESCLPIEKK